MSGTTSKEIEAHLKKHPEVKDALALTQDAHDIIYILPQLLGHKPILQLCWGEYQLFDSLTYATMTQDRFRNAQYQAAIRQQVAGKTVVDIGTGQDIVLTKLAVEAGAKKVYALEIDETAYHKAKAKVEQLGWQDKVTVIQGDAQTITLPEQVDVCISEVIGAIGSSEGTVAILNNARRFLKDDGLMIPYRCLTKVAAVYLPHYLAAQPMMNEVGAYYINQLFEQWGYPFDVRLTITNFPPENIVSNEGIFEELEFTTLMPTDYSSPIELTITQPACIDGLLLWLNLYTHPAGEVINSLTQSSNWAPIYFPIFYPGITVTVGDTIIARCQVTLSEDGVRPDYRITGEVKRQNGESIHFDYHSRLHGEGFKQNRFYERLFSAPANQVQIAPVISEPLSLPSLHDFLKEQAIETTSMPSIVSSPNLPLNSQKNIDVTQLKEQAKLNLVTLWKAQVEQTPTNVAVIYQEETLSYTALDQQANQLAYQLEQHGIGPEQLIGLSVSLSHEMIVGIWGILKAGAAFVPLDPTYPADRLKFMIADSQIKVIVTTATEAEQLAQHSIDLICLDDLLTDASPSTRPTSLTPNPYHLACCLYTSGSTGRPKGVLIEHQALARHCLAMQSVYEYTETDRGLLFASLNYVAALEQLFVPLLSGATLIIREPTLWNATTFPAKIRAYGITVADLPPNYWHALLESWLDQPALIEDLPLRLVMLGGEATRPETVRLWQQSPLRSIRFLNAYGMTETPVTPVLFEIPPTGDFKRIPIGQTTPNWQVYLLDDQLQVVPTGDMGEICIGGPSLARGYLNQPALTAEKFIPMEAESRIQAVGSKDQEVGRLYRTGDLGRWLPDGDLEYLGRQDHQVQIRGYRVELGEVEAALLSHPMVKEAAVIAQGEEDDKRLVAYAICHTEKTVWQAHEHYRHEKDILTDPAERMAFKLQQVNIQSFAGTEVALTKRVSDEALMRTYLARQSYRHFAQRQVTFDSFSYLLNSLLQLNLPDTPLPKYRYASVGGLYPVQTYLYCKSERIENIEAGFYYYHPGKHNLQLIETEKEIPPQVYPAFNQPIYQESAFALFFVAHLNAVAPMYGEKLAKEFCLLEAGYMGQLLMSEAPSYNIGLCPIDLPVPQLIAEWLRLGDDELLIHSFLGGAIDPAQTKIWLHSMTNQQSQAELKTDLQTYLQKKLPTHMMPEQIMILDNLPRTANGKVDYQALINRSTQSALPTEIILPETALEQEVHEIVQAVLKREVIGVETNFFELGANSLKMLQIQNKLQQHLGQEITIVDLFKHPTIRQLAHQLSSDITPDTTAKKSRSQSQSSVEMPNLIGVDNQAPFINLMKATLIPLQVSGDQHPFFCIPGLGSNTTYLYQLAQIVGKERPVYGFQALGLDGQNKPQQTIEEIATFYIQCLKTIQPHGPYLLGGHSLGGKIAFEMARQLHQIDETIDSLIILDSAAPPLKVAILDEVALFLEIANVYRAASGKNLVVSAEQLQHLSRTERINYLHEEFQRVGLIDSKRDITQVKGIVDVFETMLTVDYNPSLEKYPWPIILIQANDPVPEGVYLREDRSDPFWGWQTFSSADVEVYPVSGNHFTMLQSPHVEQLGGLLRDYLNKVVEKRLIE